MVFSVAGLGLALALLPDPAFAGGLECQKYASCSCYFRRTCDVKGNPLPSQEDEFTRHGGSGDAADGVLVAAIGGRVDAAANGQVIECGKGSEAFRVKLGQALEDMPREGKVPAEFENLSLIWEKSVTTRILPTFHMRQISFQTAYCGYGIQVHSTAQGEYYVFGSSVECEGERREISCRLL